MFFALATPVERIHKISRGIDISHLVNALGDVSRFLMHLHLDGTPLGWDVFWKHVEAGHRDVLQRNVDRGDVGVIMTRINELMERNVGKGYLRATCSLRNQAESATVAIPDSDFVMVDSITAPAITQESRRVLGDAPLAIAPRQKKSVKLTKGDGTDVARSRIFPRTDQEFVVLEILASQSKPVVQTNVPESGGVVIHGVAMGGAAPLKAMPTSSPRPAPSLKKKARIISLVEAKYNTVIVSAAAAAAPTVPSDGQSSTASLARVDPAAYAAASATALAKVHGKPGDALPMSTMPPLPSPLVRKEVRSPPARSEVPDQSAADPVLASEEDKMKARAKRFGTTSSSIGSAAPAAAVCPAQVA